jgi:predicted RNA binding protein YcfA (HicA-like mRNA interferase family)
LGNAALLPNLQTSITGTLFGDLSNSGSSWTAQAAGSHVIWYNPITQRYTTIPNHPGDMPEGTLRAILRQAGIERETF